MTIYSLLPYAPPCLPHVALCIIWQSIFIIQNEYQIYQRTNNQLDSSGALRPCDKNLLIEAVEKGKEAKRKSGGQDSFHASDSNTKPVVESPLPILMFESLDDDFPGPGYRKSA